MSQSTQETETPPEGSIASLVDREIESLDCFRCEFERGKHLALIQALAVTLRFRLRPPAWLAQALGIRLGQWLKLEKRTLDEALDVEWPKGKHLKTAWQKQKMEPKVYEEVGRRHAEGAPIDGGLFEAVGHDLKIGEKSKVADMYYSAADRLPFMSAESEWRMANPDEPWLWPARVPWKRPKRVPKKS